MVVRYGSEVNRSEKNNSFNDLFLPSSCFFPFINGSNHLLKSGWYHYFSLMRQRWEKSMYGKQKKGKTLLKISIGPVVHMKWKFCEILTWGKKFEYYWQLELQFCMPEVVQGVSLEILVFQMVVVQKLCIFDPMLVKPKCVWELAVYFKIVNKQKKIEKTTPQTVNTLPT